MNNPLYLLFSIFLTCVSPRSEIMERPDKSTTEDLRGSAICMLAAFRDLKNVISTSSTTLRMWCMWCVCFCVYFHQIQIYLLPHSFIPSLCSHFCSAWYSTFPRSLTSTSSIFSLLLVYIHFSQPDLQRPSFPLSSQWLL